MGYMETTNSGIESKPKPKRKPTKWEKRCIELEAGLRDIGVYASGRRFHKTVFNMVVKLLKGGGDV